MKRKKLFQWMKKWSFLTVLLFMGMVYLTCMDGWQVYGNGLVRAGERLGWLEDGAPEDDENAEKDSQEADDKSDIGMNEETENEKGMNDGEVTDGEVNDGNEEDDDGDNEEDDEEDVEEDDSEDASEAVDEKPSYRDPEDVVYLQVEDDYFTDALFIGDSRTVGMYEYGGLKDIATFYAATGLTVRKMFDAEIAEVPDEDEKVSVEEALQENEFAKIYLMLGINEMGTGTVESFMEKYQEAVEYLQELQPDAIIYLQAIMKVSTERSEQGDYINNEGIEERNEEIAKLADNVKVYYLDVNPYICDEDGGMEESYTYDGVHLKAQYTGIWKEFLKAFAVDYSLGE